MPTTRIMVRRDLTQAVTRVEGVQKYLARSGQLYEKDHPKEYQLFCAAMQIADILKEALTRLRSHL